MSSEEECAASQVQCNGSYDCNGLMQISRYCWSCGELELWGSELGTNYFLQHRLCYIYFTFEMLCSGN